MLQGYKFTLDLFVLKSKRVDMVLRMHWLQSLGVILHDYKSLTMDFTW